MNIVINDQSINYVVRGEGKPVLLLHGWGAEIDSFAPVTNELEKGRKVYVIDFPGFGKSEEPKYAFEVFDFTEIVKGFIETVIGEKTDIICHSFGGRVTILLAAKYPELVDKIVFTDAAGIRPKRGIKYYSKVYSYKFAKKLAKTKSAKKIFKAVGFDADKKIANSGSEDYRKLNGVMRETFVKVVNEDLTHYLRDIKSPSLLIYGENDTATPVRFGKIMEREIKDSGLVILEDAGHFSYLDQFPRYISIVKVFLGVQ